MCFSDVVWDVFFMGGDCVEIMDDGVGGWCCCFMVVWICLKVNEDGSLFSWWMDFMLVLMKLDMVLIVVLFLCVVMVFVFGVVFVLVRCIVFSVCGVGLVFGVLWMFVWILFMILLKLMFSFCCWVDMYVGVVLSIVFWVRIKKDLFWIFCFIRF